MGQQIDLGSAKYQQDYLCLEQIVEKYWYWLLYQACSQCNWPKSYNFPWIQLEALLLPP